MIRYVIRASIAVLACWPCIAASADGVWKPSRTLEFVTSGGPGGSQDRVVRLLQKIAQEKNLLGATSTVTNKTGAGGALSLAYLAQHPGNGHYTVLVSPTFATNHITGRTTLGPGEVTPLANLFSDYLAFLVRADSTIRNGRDLVETMLRNSQALSIGIGSNLGNLNHMSVVKLMRSSGMPDAEIRKLKTIAFKGGGDSITALLGGHIDLLVYTAGNTIPHVQSGKLRMVAITAPRRASGPFASVPTWKEQGHDVVHDAWRMMLGPPAMSAPQVAYWEQVFARAVQEPDWKSELEANLWEPDFKRAREAKAYLESEYNEMKDLLVALGMIKR